MLGPKWAECDDTEKPPHLHLWICSPYCCICLNRGTVSLIFAKYAINAYFSNLVHLKEGELQFDVIYYGSW